LKRGHILKYEDFDEPFTCLNW